MNYLAFTTLIIIFISFFFSFFLFTVKTKNKISNIIIASYLIVVSIEISVFFYQSYIEIPKTLDFIRDRVSLLQSPLLFIYVISMLYSDFKLKRKHLIHIVPFIIFVLPITAIPINSYFETLIYSDRSLFFFIFFIHIQFLSYIIATFIALHRFKKILLENYSQANIMTYKWLLQLNILISVVFGFAIFKNIFNIISENPETTNLIRIIMVVLVLGFICWIILKGLYHPQIFRGIDSNLKPIGEIISHTTTENKEVSISLDTQHQIGLLKKYMEDKKPYLDPTLTIQNLAYQINLPSREVSILINHHLNKHFFDLVNEYRIKRAMEILKNPDHRKLTILEILYEVGFNSKSSFNTAFKKHTNTTPTQYRKNN